jgi:hypothetical protein
VASKTAVARTVTVLRWWGIRGVNGHRGLENVVRPSFYVRKIFRVRRDVSATPDTYVRRDFGFRRRITFSPPKRYWTVTVQVAE